MMKKKDYTDIICKRFCTFYKPGKEVLSCGTYAFISRNLTLGELESAIRGIASTPDFACDMKIRRLICEKCDFVLDGCAFMEGLEAPPCGGYTIVEWLLKREPLARFYS